MKKKQSHQIIIKIWTISLDFLFFLQITCFEQKNNIGLTIFVWKFSRHAGAKTNDCIAPLVRQKCVRLGYEMKLSLTTKEDVLHNDGEQNILPYFALFATKIVLYIYVWAI